MRFLAALSFLLVQNTLIATSPQCEKWFFESTKVDPGIPDCPVRCASATVGMNAFMCPLECKDLCKIALDRYIVDELTYPYTLTEAEKRWSSKAFDQKEFKKGNQKIRASMAVALIKSKKYVGKPISFVREELGEWDGYFEADGIPAYLIESGDTGSKEAWEILFLPDKTGRNVEEIKIHKNCC